MKLLIICQYYDPEPFRVHDLCVGLTARGHQVQVLTGMPNYPLGDFYPGFERNKPIDETKDAVHIHRCPIHPRKHGAIHRLWNYASFPRAAAKWLKHTEQRFDVVLVYQLSPVMMAEPGLRYAKQHGCPLVLYCLDLWPESLLAGGIRRDSAIYRYFQRVSGKIYGKADRILISSEQFRGYLLEMFGIPDARIGYLPQYAEEIFSPVENNSRRTVTELCFAGNIGALQGLETVLDAAKLLEQEPVRFNLVGDGSDLERLRALAKERKLRNVSFPGRLPVEEMPALYADADAMLITMRRDAVLNLTLPGKLQSYLAAGKPVIGAIEGEAARIIHDAGCGFCGPAEDPGALAENIRRFMAEPDKAALGRRARTYYDGHFTRERFLDALESVLKELTGESGT